MQLSATTTAAKPLPVDLLPEALFPYFPSVSFQSPSRRSRPLPRGDVFASRGLGARPAFSDGIDVAEFKGCKSAQPWMIRAGLGG